MQSNKWHHVEDILQEIFSFEFLDTIQTKYTLVCKAWYDVVNNERFVHIYNMNATHLSSILSSKNNDMIESLFSWIPLMYTIDPVSYEIWSQLQTMTFNIHKSVPQNTNTNDPHIVMCFEIPYRQNRVKLYFHSYRRNVVVSAYVDPTTGNIVSASDSNNKLEKFTMQYCSRLMMTDIVDDYQYVGESNGNHWILRALSDYTTHIGEHVFIAFLETIYKYYSNLHKYRTRINGYWIHQMGQTISHTCFFDEYYNLEKEMKTEEIKKFQKIRKLIRRIEMLTNSNEDLLRLAINNSKLTIAERLLICGYTVNTDCLRDKLLDIANEPSSGDTGIIDFIFEYLESKQINTEVLDIMRIYDVAILKNNIVVVEKLLQYTTPTGTIWTAFDIDTGSIHKQLIDYICDTVAPKNVNCPLVTKLTPINKPIINHLVMCHKYNDMQLFQKNVLHAQSSKISTIFSDEVTINTKVIMTPKRFNRKHRLKWIKEVKQSNQIDTILYFVDTTHYNTIDSCNKVLRMIYTAILDLVESGFPVVLAFVPNIVETNLRRKTSRLNMLSDAFKKWKSLPLFKLIPVVKDYDPRVLLHITEQETD
jgi:hypothetical protein